MKKSVLVAFSTCISTISLGAHAELQSLDDTSLSNMTGQAGLTIELEAKVDIGEVNYKDEGNIFLTGISFGGIGSVQSKYGVPVTFGESLDNVRLDIDVAGDGADSTNLMLNAGLRKFDAPISSGDITELANVGSHGETAILIDDGDLVISLGAIDKSERIDYGLTIDKISLAESYYTAGDSLLYATNTTLVSQLAIYGDIGTVDVVIDADYNLMNINTYFSAFGGATLDFIGTSFNFALTNSRGYDVLGYEYSNGDVISFAHAQVDLGAHADPSKGLYINVMDFSGDLDLTNIRFGSEPTIGDVYVTDLTIQANMNVYGH